MGMMAAHPGCPALVKTFHMPATISSTTAAQRMVMPIAIPCRAALLGTDGALSDWKNNIASKELIEFSSSTKFFGARKLRQFWSQRQLSFAEDLRHARQQHLIFDGLTDEVGSADLEGAHFHFVARQTR